MKFFICFPIQIIFILICPISSAQLVTVSGHIRDGETKEYLEYTNIYDGVSGIGTISNSTGYFKLLLRSRETSITFSKTGYKEIIQSFVLQKDTTLNVILEQKQLNKPKPIKVSELSITNRKSTKRK